MRDANRRAGATGRPVPGTLRLVVACSALAALAACTPALREPPPIATAPGGPAAKDAPELMRRADEAWRRRADPAQASRAQELYLQAASADERDAAPLLGAMRAMAFRIERERDGGARAALATREVELGQWCQRRAPSDPACDYRLALALGQQARERPATARDGLARMVTLLRRVIAANPSLDSAGAHRTLALVLLRAPAWPLGPGDPEAGLEEARKAAALFPEVAGNQLALGEALGKNGQPEAAGAAYQRALALANAEVAAGDPDGERTRAEARTGAEQYGKR